MKFWALENPSRGLLKNFIGKPAFIFNPYEFGDMYKKETALWGNFKEPKNIIEEREGNLYALTGKALGKLNEGVGVDPTSQRIWLTLGFVNSQLGNTEQAHTALTTAVKINADNEIGQSAVKMLENLP